MELPSWLMSFRCSLSFGFSNLCLLIGIGAVEGASSGRDIAGISCWKYGGITGMLKFTIYLVDYFDKVEL